MVKVEKVKNSSAKRFLQLSILFITLLNLLAFKYTIYNWSHFFGTITMFISIYPMYRFLREDKERIPFFQFISLFYGGYYSVAIFIPFDEYFLLGVSRDSLAAVSALSCLGIGIMVYCYYHGPFNYVSQYIPQISSSWSEKKVKHLAVILSSLGLISRGASFINEVPTVIASLVDLISLFGMLGISILFYLSINSKLHINYLIFLYGFLIPMWLIMFISSGTIFPIIRLGLLFLMIYISVRKNIPWKVIFIGMLIALPILAFKFEYRKLNWYEGKTESASFTDFLGKSTSFLDIVVSGIGEFDSEMILPLTQDLIRRIDLLTSFEYIREQVPDPIPYLNGKTYATILWKFIPRILYPDKPKEDFGNEFGHQYNYLDANDFVTSVNLPQMIEMFINFGVLGVILGMGILSQIYRFFSHLIGHVQAGDWEIISGSLVLSSLFNIESNFTLVFGAVAQTLLMVYVVGLFAVKVRFVSSI